MGIVEKIQKLYAVIESKRSQKGSINTVIGFRLDDGRLITEPKAIHAIFGEPAEVFAGRTFEGKNEGILVGEIIEIPVIELLMDEQPKPAVQHQPVIRKKIFPVLEILQSLIHDNYLDLQTISGSLHHTESLRIIGSERYLSNGNRLYGPFKLINNKLEPTGKEASIFELHPAELLYYRGETILMEKPQAEMGRIDCMTSVQLLEWVKEKVNVMGTNQNAEINLIKDLLKRSDQSYSDLDASRYTRSLALLDKLELSLQELRKFKDTHQSWSEVFDRAYQRHRNELAQEHIDTLQSENVLYRQKHEAKWNELSIELERIQAQTTSESLRLAQLHREIAEGQRSIDYLNSHQEQLLLNLKIQAKVFPSVQLNPAQSDRQDTYEMREFSATSDQNCEDLEDYLDFLRNEIRIPTPARKLFESTLGVMVDKKFLLCNSTSFLLSLIASMGNGTLCLQQAEADWIKFERLYQNGLKNILELAEANPNRRHFYILQDFNLPSLACYGRPLLDIADRLRLLIPGTQRTWPENLYVILVPISNPEEGLGFEINPQQFNNWGILPFIKEFPDYARKSPAMTIDLLLIADQLIDRDSADISSYLNI